jgi:hypothetical protein
MTGRHWLRKDVLLPIFYILAFGAVLYWLYGLLRQSPKLAGSDVVQMVILAIAGIYGLLVLITIRHVLSSYDLERYDPGNPASLKRLMRRRRFRLPRHQVREADLLVAIERRLLGHSYILETESHQIGRVYRRHHQAGLIANHFDDRVIILQHEPLNVLIVDQLLQDCIRHIRSHPDKISRRNLLILVTRMAETPDAASAAAGIVNFLGKFKGGTLCPLLLATRQYRLFYPADRTLLPRSHRIFQNSQIRWLKHLIRHALKEKSAPQAELMQNQDQATESTDIS